MVNFSLAVYERQVLILANSERHRQLLAKTSRCVKVDGGLAAVQQRSSFIHSFIHSFIQE